MCAAHRDAGVLTLVCATGPGFELRDARGGAWIATPGGPGRCVAIAGKAARAHGFAAAAVEHRVVPQRVARASVTFDLHPTPERAARSAALSAQRLYFEMRINTR